MSLPDLLQRADIWRGDQTPPAVNDTGLSSGFAELDALFGDSSKEAAQGNASDALKDAEALFDD